MAKDRQKFSEYTANGAEPWLSSLPWNGCRVAPSQSRTLWQRLMPSARRAVPLRAGKPSASTYRTVSYVRALKLTQDSCLGFICQNGLEDEIKRLLKYREALEQTWLFGETISPPVQNKIAKSMKMREYYQAGVLLEDVPADSTFIGDSG